MAHESLWRKLRSVRRRLLVVAGTAGLIWGLVAAIALLLAGVWLDLLWDFSPQGRIAVVVLAAAAGAVLTALLIAAAIRAGRSALVARRLDRAAGSGGQILTGMELDAPPPAVAKEPLTSGLAHMAVDHAARVAAGVPGGRAVSTRPLLRALVVLGCLLLGVGILALAVDGLIGTAWARFTSPSEDVPPFSRTQFEVEPGDCEVLYGDPLDVRATAVGEPVDRAELVLQTDDGRETVLPMFPEPGGRWRAALARVTEPGQYHVRAYRARSQRYAIGVITVPQIEDVKVTISPPAYTRRTPYEGPVPKEGVAGIAGTRVRFRAHSNRPLSGGKITVTGAGSPEEYPMQPVEGEAQEVAGEFSITHDGKFQIRVQDEDGQWSREEDAFTGTITLLADRRPVVRLQEPRETSLATPTAMLPVEVGAEDDCGVARLQLYRSLNDSRAMPTDLRLPEVPPRRVGDRVFLPLGAFGLSPGDTIKLFGRAEDNDPAGAKGSESPVATVRIISQEDFERLQRRREGLNLLLSKYGAARRRMESLAQEMEGLMKKIKESPPGDPVAEENRRRLRTLRRRMRKEAEEIRRSAENVLPYDLDKSLTGQLAKLADALEGMAGQMEGLEGLTDQLNKDLLEQLAKLLAELNQGRHRLAREATEPLELLADVFPLLADAQRFIVIVLRQKDLAERLASIKDKTGGDDPALKSRMGDLEAEQRQLREDLIALLGDIEDHAERLPDDERLETLRETAREFVSKVRASGAIEAMSEAELGLAELDGKRGYENAKRAADILAQFISMCQGMGGACRGCLKFQPSLSAGMGNTLDQLLAEMGMGAGSDGMSGMGPGMGGYSSRRGGFGNVGLYGGLPGMDNPPEAGLGDQDAANDTGPGRFAREGENPDEPTWDDLSGTTSAAGFGAQSVPLRYRARVRDYLRRVAEEVQER